MVSAKPFLLSSARCLMAACCLLLCSTGRAQLAVNQGAAAYLIQNVFLGEGVTVSNITYTGQPMSFGYFQFTGGNIGLERGILLCSGDISDARGPNNSTGAGMATGGPSLPVLNALTTGSTTDGAMIEFDFVPNESIVNFRYIFGSEEYPEYAGSQYNDVFGFFISGPGILGEKNMALIPNSNIPITINNVNNGTANTGPCNHCEYYKANTGNIVQYDGYTTVLTASSDVLPCQTYHLRIAIADVGDPAFDSGVFLSAESLCSNKTVIQSVRKLPPNYFLDVVVDTVNYEGCTPVKIYIKRACQVEFPADVKITYAGTATPGTDYEPLPDSIHFIAGQDVIELKLTSYNDKLNEGTETVTLSVNNRQCGQTVANSKTFYIRDKELFTDLGNDTTLCAGQTLTLSPGMLPPPDSYVWQDLSYQPTYLVKQPGKYWVRMQKGSCIMYDTMQVTYISSPLVALGNDSIVCENQSVLLTAVSNSSSNSFIWSSGASGTTLLAKTAGIYWVKATAANGCSAADSVTIIQQPKPLLNLGNDTAICVNPKDSFVINASIPGGYAYRWNYLNATTPSIKVAQSGAYSVTLTGRYCTVSDTMHVAMNPNPVVNLGPDTFFCSGHSVRLSAGKGFDSYEWTFLQPDSFIVVTQQGQQRVTVTKNGCRGSDTIVVTVRNTPPVNIGHDTSFCRGDSIRLSMSGASGSTYLWSTGAQTASTFVHSAGQAWGMLTYKGCPATDTVMINAVGNTVPWLGSDTSLCIRGRQTLDAGSGCDHYRWSTGDTTQAITVGASGSYWVITRKAQCADADTISLQLNPYPVVDLGSDTIRCSGDTIRFDVSCQHCTYSWNTGSSQPTATIDTAGIYAVSVSSNAHCSSSDTVQIGFVSIPAF